VLRKRDIDEALAKVPLFSACSKKELAQVRKHSTRLSFPAGTEIMRKGQRGEEFMVILEGQAKVAWDSRSIALGPGDFFGEIALLDGGPRTATVTATTDLDAEVMSHQEFTALLLEAPSMTRNILRGVASRLRGEREG
jgi:CRP-like cAMP-binding protein